MVEQIVLTYAPMVAVILGIAISLLKNKKIVGKVCEHVDDLKNKVLETKEYRELKHQLVIVHEENIILKKKLNELLTKIDRVARDDNEKQENKTL